MLLTHTLLVPSLPTLLVDQHRGHRTPMIEALDHASERLLGEAPAAIVILSARWSSTGPFLVGAAKRHGTITDYTGFGVEVRYDCPGQPALARALVDAAVKARVRAGSSPRGIDSGASVPLHFLAPRGGVPVVPLSIAAQPPEACRAWGATLRVALAAWPDPVAFVVGGVLSRNEHAWLLRREVPEAQTLDERVLEALGRGEWTGLAGDDAARFEKAQPEAGLRHLEVIRGFLGTEATGTVRCYEPGPGVGAALIEFPLTGAVTDAPPAKARAVPAARPVDAPRARAAEKRRPRP